MTLKVLSFKYLPLYILVFFSSAHSSVASIIEISFSGNVTSVTSEYLDLAPTGIAIPAHNGDPVDHISAGDAVTGRIQIDSASVSLYPSNVRPDSREYIARANSKFELYIGGSNWSLSDSLKVGVSNGNKDLYHYDSLDVWSKFGGSFLDPAINSFDYALSVDKWPGGVRADDEASYSISNELWLELQSESNWLNTVNVPSSTEDFNLENLGSENNYENPEPGEFIYLFGGIASSQRFLWGGSGVFFGFTRNWSIDFEIDPTSIAISDTASPPPELSELAQMAQCAYGGACLIPKYNTVELGSLSGAPGTFAAVALVNDEDNQVVLSIRGTDDTTDWLSVNPTFIDKNGEPTDLFRDYVKAAADSLIELSSLYPDAEITLTGHSLGGALAQLLAYATGFPATTFNAPGAAQVIQKLEPQLSGLSSLSNPLGSLGVTNYRLYGDLVSTIGAQVGSTITYEPPIERWKIDSFPGGTAKPMHEMLFLSERIINNGPTTEDIGPVFTETLADVFFDLAQGVYGPSALISPITSAVIAGQQIWVDPEDYDLYQFTVDPGSPNVRSLIFPFISQFDALFDLQALINDEWSSLGYFDELYEYDFGSEGVDRFKFFVVDENTYLPPSYIEPLTFGMTFVADGVMSGNVVALSTRVANTIPTPTTLALFALGLTVLVWSRHKNA